MSSNKVFVNSKNVKYNEDFIETDYEYNSTKVQLDHGHIVATPVRSHLHIRTRRQVPSVGLMLVGWGGNNGSTLTAAVVANKLQLTWETKDGKESANWYGSITQSSTVRLGTGPHGEDVYVPMSEVLPMVKPEDLIIDGWDISSVNLAEAMVRARVLDWNLQQKLYAHLEKMRPRPSIYYPDFIAENQATRADNIIQGSKFEQMQQIRKDIQEFKMAHDLDKVIIIWTANTERFCEILPGLNDTASNILSSIRQNSSEISPSTLFAAAAILENCTFINGSPQNTFVPGIIQLAEENKVFIGGDDFKSGQTKLKSVLVDFLVSAGIKPVSIVSYNHLGNNDGKNLSAPQQFHSKEVSKSNVIDDVVESNKVLYKAGEKPDHCVVIKYVPYVGDSKRAMDEYTSEIFMGGRSTIVIHNTCEDSLLASPIILDLALLAELCNRIEFRSLSEPDSEYCKFHPVLSILSYLCKAPLVPPGTPVVNVLSKQRACIENIMRACIGLPPEHNMLLEHKLSLPLLEMPFSDVELPKTVKLSAGHGVNGFATDMTKKNLDDIYQKNPIKA